MPVAASCAQPEASGAADARHRWSADLARAHWREAMPAEAPGSLVPVYFATRGLALPADAPLRFHPRAWRNAAFGPSGPAMVALTASRKRASPAACISPTCARTVLERRTGGRPKVDARRRRRGAPGAGGRGDAGPGAGRGHRDGARRDAARGMGAGVGGDLRRVDRALPGARRHRVPDGVRGRRRGRAGHQGRARVLPAVVRRGRRRACSPRRSAIGTARCRARDGPHDGGATRSRSRAPRSRRARGALPLPSHHRRAASPSGACAC